MEKTLHLILGPAVMLLLPWLGGAQMQAQNRQGPDAFVYERAGGRDLKLYVFEPAQSDYKKPRGAVVLFHGGGWSTGSAEWMFGQASYFASLGMVGISVDYRLSNGSDVTPFEAVEDAKAAIRWVRGHAALLNIDPKKIAAYGESAGGHLAAATAIVGDNPSREELNGVPNALALYSPALNAEKNERFRKLVRAGQDVANILPVEHIHEDMPPTIILTGELDTMPAPITLIDFCEKMKQAHNRCELQVFPGVGHLLLEPGKGRRENGSASKTEFDAFLKLDQFLLSLGYLPAEKRN
jgi:acetyl esterase/lipase